MSLPKLKKILVFDWDEANIAHNVQDEDIEHSTVEERFLIIGRTKEKVIVQDLTKEIILRA